MKLFWAEASPWVRLPGLVFFMVTSNSKILQLGVYPCIALVPLTHWRRFLQPAVQAFGNVVVGREDIKFHVNMENGFLLLLFDMIYLASEHRIENIQEREPNHSDFEISI